MKKRSITSVFIVLVVILALMSKFIPRQVGDYLFDIFIVCIGIVASFEMCNIMERMGKRINRSLVTMYLVFNYSILVATLGELKYYLIIAIEAICLIVYFLLVLIVESIRNQGNIIEKVKCSWNSILACIYPGLLFSLLLNLNHIDMYAGVKHFSIPFIMMIFVVTMLTDTFAYLVGRTFKGPKLCPKISPNKTISGSIGGLLGGLAGAMIIYALMYNTEWATILSTFSLKWWHFLFIGFISSVLGQCGDLFESKLKRSANIKDSGNLLPGHGGMLDRIDAMIFVVTVMYIVTLVIII